VHTGDNQMMRDETSHIVQWLRDGREGEAADLLAECSLHYIFVDLLFELGGGNREFSLMDVNIEAPRRILEEIKTSLAPQVKQIENAVHECAYTMSYGIRHISWVPKLVVSNKTSVEEQISKILAQIDSEHIHKAWERALDRKNDDPEGAITAARTLVESVCKHILDKAGKTYSQSIDLPQLYHFTSEHLQLSPNQYTEKIVRQVLGNCQSVINGLAALRNKLGDAHGKSADELSPTSAYAELAVNLAGTMATFLISIQEGSPKEDELK
jgi:hypothetical protein